MVAKTEKYRPSNGTEGEWFQAKFCENCTKDSEARPCRILGYTMIFDVDDKDYPKQWVKDVGAEWPGNPRCTAFSDRSLRKPRGRSSRVRDKRQIQIGI